MKRGKVYLVGAGPGDPELMTIKGQRLLHEADVVLFDRLANPEILADLPERIELIDVGKSSGHHKSTQDEINQLLIEKAETGKTVVRLKGGDPYLFGRGGEEALALAERGILFETVPGVTSAISVPAGVGIPVTHRGITPAVTIVTGHEEPGKDKNLNWNALAKLGGTIVVLMGVARLEENISMLLAGGRPPETPAAIIEKGGRPDERVVLGSLKDIAARAREMNVKPPAILVVGEVVSLIGKLGRHKIAILRPKNQLERSAEIAESYGFQPICASAISFRKLELPQDLLPRIEQADCVVFTSATGADIAQEDSSVSEILKRKRIAAIGPKTAQKIEESGLKATLMPEKYSSEGLFKVLKENCTHILLLRSAQGSRNLVKDLKEAGLEVDDIHLYEITASGDPRLDKLINSGEVDVFAFTSASTARCLIKRAREMGLEDSLREKLHNAIVAAIGPPTAAELERLEVDVDVMPEDYTFEAMLQQIAASLYSEGR